MEKVDERIAQLATEGELDSSGVGPFYGVIELPGARAPTNPS